MADRRGFGVLAGGHELKRPLRNLGVDKIILKWIFKKCDGGGMDWIGLAEERDSWLSLVNAVKKLKVP